MGLFGIDYAWGSVNYDELLRRDVKFVMRYFSHDSSKDLDLREAQRLTEQNIWIGVVWETTANRALSGYEAGKADAENAEQLGQVCHMPEGRPIYFAVDWDAGIGDQAKIHSYLDGVASVIGRDRTGLYAGYWPIKRAFDAGKIKWGWQTYAWSGGKWDSRAQLRQYSNGHILAGVDCDYDTAMADDFGQWQIGKVPMALTDAEWTKLRGIIRDEIKNAVDDIRDGVWESDTCPVPDGYESEANPTWRFRNVLRTGATESHAANGGIAALTEKVDDILAKLNAIQ